jgi:protoporphyrin/coproporphyrin ferrochelatase
LAIQSYPATALPKSFRNMSDKKRAVLLVNLGSPDSTSVSDVRKYLREFLMDARVLDAPYPIRWCIVNLSILPKRPAQSAEAYRTVWTKEGSPLIVTSKSLRARLQSRLGIPVELAMRYQNPSIETAVRELKKNQISDVLLVPLFPHYAMSSYETAVVRVQEVMGKIASQIRLQVLPPYYDQPYYINALVGVAKPYLNEGYDHLLFSFHGIPERHLRKADPTGSHCLSTPDCCQKPCAAPKTCYRAQCFKTVEAFVKLAHIPEGKYSVAFQSRLGRDPWLQPYTDAVVEQFGHARMKKLLVICPAFVSDCLETLEEIGDRARETFREAGGGELQRIPCLNDNPLWVEALAKLVSQSAR